MLSRKDTRRSLEVWCAVPASVIHFNAPQSLLSYDAAVLVRILGLIQEALMSGVITTKR